MKRITWDGEQFSFDNYTFAYEAFAKKDKVSSSGLIVNKHRELLEAVIAILDDVQPKRIFELGIFAGGSTSFIAAYASPEKHTAIEYSPDPLPALQAFLEEHELDKRVFPFFGVDQSDEARLREIATNVFGSDPLDLVIDDASHQLVETRKSFETLFPRLRPGGMYVIEDWQWGLKPIRIRDRVKYKFSYKDFPKGQTLALMPMELVMAAAKNDVIRSLTVDEHFVKIERGEAQLDDNFRITDLYPPEASELLGRHDIIDNPTQPPPLPIRLYRKFYRTITGTPKPD